MTDAPSKDCSVYQTLTRKMILTVIVVSFAPLILVIAALLYQFNLSYHAKTRAHLVELIEKHRQEIDSFLREKLGNIRFLSVTSDLAMLESDTFLQDKLRMLQQEYGAVFSDLGLVDDTGIQIAYAGPFRLENANYLDAGWFQEAMTSDTFISDVFLGLRGHPHFIVAVRKMSGGRTRILRATIDFIAFNNLVENLRIGRTGSAYILNREGKYQTKPPQHANAGYIKKLWDRHPQAGEIDIVDDRAADGLSRIYVSALLKDNEWMLVFQQEAADAFADLRRTEKIAAAIFFVGGCGILGMAVFLTRRIVRIIRKADTKSEMMNKQIVETGKLASLGELAAGIAHEINNPVAIMVEEAGWIGDLLEEEDLKDSENLVEFMRALAQINTQGKRCKAITHKLLSFARKTDTTVGEVQVNEVVKEIVALSSQLAANGHVSINTHLQHSLPPIHISESELQQVLLNLINNALYAIEKNEGVIDIYSKRNKNQIVIDVADNGPGIPEANLTRIFDPFFTTKPVGRGTGLGLSICYGIIRKMGGNLDVDSTVGVGTRFRIILPLERAHHQSRSRRPGAFIQQLGETVAPNPAIAAKGGTKND